jgi:hypothetical protein
MPETRPPNVGSKDNIGKLDGKRKAGATVALRRYTNHVIMRRNRMQSTMILAKGIIVSVIEGEKGMMDTLRRHSRECELVLLLSCLIEGLERAESPTARGLRDLAELISIAHLKVIGDRSVCEPNAQTQGMLTPDALLSGVLGRIEGSAITGMFRQIPIVTSDASLVAALLCVEDEDDLTTANLAEILSVTTVTLADSSETDRATWHKQLSPATIRKIRSKSSCNS